jgi:hypothetical protein
LQKETSKIFEQKGLNNQKNLLVGEELKRRKMENARNMVRQEACGFRDNHSACSVSAFLWNSILATAMGRV